MTRTLLAILTVIILTGGALLPPVRADTGVSFIYTAERELLRPALSWTIPILASPQLTADGLLTSDGRYGIGVATPMTTLTDPLWAWTGAQPSGEFTAILRAVSVGGAVLTTNLRDCEGGLYVRVTAFALNW